MTALVVLAVAGLAAIALLARPDRDRWPTACESCQRRRATRRHRFPDGAAFHVCATCHPEYLGADIMRAQGRAPSGARVIDLPNRLPHRTRGR